MGGFSTVATNTSGLEGRLEYIKNGVDEILAIVSAGSGGGVSSPIIQALLETATTQVNAATSSQIGMAFTSNGVTITKVVTCMSASGFAASCKGHLYEVGANDIPVGSPIDSSSNTVSLFSDTRGTFVFTFNCPTVAGKRYLFAVEVTTGASYVIFPSADVAVTDFSQQRTYTSSGGWVARSRYMFLIVAGA